MGLVISNVWVIGLGAYPNLQKWAYWDCMYETQQFDALIVLQVDLEVAIADTDS